MGRQPGQPIADKLLLYAFTMSYAAMLIISSADGSRWHIWPAPPITIAYAGLALFAAGWWLVLRALETNAFAVRVVRHQPERGHRVIDTGVYRIVRHPMYAGLVAVMIGAPLWLSSTLGVLLAAAPIGFLALRILTYGRTHPSANTSADMYGTRITRAAAADSGGVVRRRRVTGVFARWLVHDCPTSRLTSNVTAYPPPSLHEENRRASSQPCMVPVLQRQSDESGEPPSAHPLMG